VLALACALLPAHAATVQVARSTSAGLLGGTSDGIAATSGGRLFASPRIVALGADRDELAPVHVWSAVADPTGNVYLGTGPDGHVLQVGRSGEPRSFYQVPGPMVTALAVTPGGEILAASAPGGAIHRVAADGTGEVWVETQERYVWSLLVTPDGDVFAGTGESGRVLRIDSSGNVETVLDAEEAHIVSLASGADGLLAGGAGSGLIYAIDDEGHAMVLHDADLPEVAALSLEPDGSILAALLAPPAVATKRPAVQLRLPDGVQVGVTDASVGALEERSGPTVRGVIEGLATEEAELPARVRGRVVRIHADGTSTVLWSSTTEAPFAMAQDRRGRTMFGTGEPASLYRIESDGDVARLARFAEGQATGLVAAGRGWTLLATSNPARAYRIEDAPDDVGLFLSSPIDAGAPARWGRITWQVDRASGRTEMYTRTGNSRVPDETWSGWSPAMFDPSSSTVASPEGRFLQWRLRQLEAGDPPPLVSGVEVRFEPFNRSPGLGAFGVRGDASSFSGAIPLRWAVEDPDGDAVDVVVEYRPVAGGGAWARAVGAQSSEATDGSPSRPPIEVDWDTAGVPEGEYALRATANDRASNAEGEGLEARERPEVRVVVDRTPPGLVLASVNAGGDAATPPVRAVIVVDEHSPLSRLEVVQDGVVRYRARPVDGLCDSPRETFLIRLPEDATGTWIVRGVDLAGNDAELELGPTETP
jgi:hypothetical protein